MNRFSVALVVVVLLSPGLCAGQSTGKIDFEGLVEAYFKWEEGMVSRSGCLPDSGCYQSADYSSYGLSAARLLLKARATDRISAELTLDVSRSPVILEGFVDIFLKDWAIFRAGQFTLPYGFENSVSRFNLMTGDRSLMAHYLWNNGVSSAYLRDMGLMLKGKYSLLSYEFAQVNGAGFDYTADGTGGLVSWGRDNNNCKDYVGRLHIGVPLFAGLGFSVYRGKWVEDASRNSWAFDLYLDTGKVIFQTEYERGHGVMLDGEWSDTDHRGYHVLAGYRFIPLLEGIYQYDKFDPTSGWGKDTVRDHYFGINLNFRRTSKLRVFYVRRTEEPFDFENDRVQVYMSAKF
jgi:hypothetical protein